MGFAEYFGAPKSLKLKVTDQLSEPVITAQPKASRRYPNYWMFAMTAVTCLALVWLFFKRTRRLS
jgi:ABC-type uncharacterized transport system permease subunit